MSFPPTLSKIGDKLKLPWLRRAIEEGARVRPAIKARMPRFGIGNVRGLAEALIAADRRPTPSPKVNDQASLLKEAGRKLVGNSGLGCVRCHVFNRHEAATVQAPDLILTTERVHRDWFERFVKDPESLKPGTRMPKFWSDNVGTIKNILDGDADRPDRCHVGPTSPMDARPFTLTGLTRKQLELIVGGKARLYRGKIWEAGFRGICVGYPDQLNLGFDAEELRLALLWKGRFLNVAAHWRVQGMGRIRPLGHSVLKFPHGAGLRGPRERRNLGGRRTVADARVIASSAMTSTHSASPPCATLSQESRSKTSRECGSRARRLACGARSASKRTIPRGLHFRAAVGRSITTQQGAFVVDGDLRLRDRGRGGPRSKSPSEMQTALRNSSSRSRRRFENSSSSTSGGRVDEDPRLLPHRLLRFAPGSNAQWRPARLTRHASATRGNQQRSSRPKFRAKPTTTRSASSSSHRRSISRRCPSKSCRTTSSQSARDAATSGFARGLLSDKPDESYRLFASGLHEIFGLDRRDGWLYATTAGRGHAHARPRW